jgi:hypothetical protein
MSAPNAIGLDCTFVIDENFHVRDGELHCGTNQVHPALDDQRKRCWDHPPQ